MDFWDGRAKPAILEAVEAACSKVRQELVVGECWETVDCFWQPANAQQSFNNETRIAMLFSPKKSNVSRTLLQEQCS